MKKAISIFILISIFMFTGCSDTKEKEHEVESNREVENETIEIIEGIPCGIYSDGKGKMQIQEDGYAQFIPDVYTNTSVFGEYSMEGDILCIYGNENDYVKLKIIDGHFYLIRYFISGTFNAYAEGECEYYYVSNGMGDQKILQEFFDMFKENDKLADLPDGLSYGNYEDGEESILIVKENGYAHLWKKYGDNMTGVLGKYSVEGDSFYIRESDVTYAEFKYVDGELHLIKRCVKRILYEYKEGDCVYCYEPEETGYSYIAPEFWDTLVEAEGNNKEGTEIVEIIEGVPCGTYSDGEQGVLMIKENGYAEFDMYWDSNIGYLLGKYSMENDVLCIYKDDYNYAEFKKEDNHFYLITYCAMGVFSEYAESECEYYYATNEIGYHEIPQEFFDDFKDNEETVEYIDGLSYGNYKSGEDSILIAKENGYAHLWKKYGDNMIGVLGKYSVEGDNLYIRESDATYAEFKHVDGELHLIKICIEGILYEYREGDCVYCYDQGKYGYYDIAPEFWGTISEAEKTTNLSKESVMFRL